MKFHTGVPMSAPKYDPEAISALARKADEVGYHYIGGAERLIMPRVIHSLYPRGTGEIPGVGTGQNMLEAQSTMSFIAGQTKQIRLMPFFVVPYRNPILAAKMLATIDVLSNGRMNILIGPGWNREEAAAMLMPTPWEKRGAVTNEYLRAFTELWSKENPTFHGKYLTIEDVDFAPKPVQQPHIPYWIGGESPPALRRAALLGDGWAPAANNQDHPIETDEKLVAALDSIKRRGEAAGRDMSNFGLRWGGLSWDGGDPNAGTGPDRKPLTGTAEQVAEDVRAQAKLGVTNMSAGSSADSLAGQLEMMESFATEVMPLVAD
jgi:probable F420-dependent oxidoreductase